MIRLFNIPFVLMGLLLLTISLGGTMLRPTDSTEFVPLMIEQGLFDTPYRFFQIWPGVPRPLMLTPDGMGRLRFWGIDTAGQSAYVAASDVNLQRVSFYQLRSSHPRPIVENGYADTLRVSPNFAWVLYATDDPDGGWEYWAVHTQTGRRWSVSALVQPRSVAFRGSHIFSTDEQRLYLTVQELAPPRYEVVAIDLSDGAVVDVTNGKGGALGVHLQGVVNDWLIFDRGGEMYRIHPDGSDFSVLYDPLVRSSEDRPTLPAFVFATYPAYGLAIIHQDTQTIAVDVEAAKIRWQYENLSFGLTDDSPTGWVTLSQNFRGVRLHVPTGEIQPLPDIFSVPATYLHGDSPDGQWTFYNQRNPITGVFAWRRYHWATGEIRLIRTQMEYFLYHGMSPDGVWLLAEDNRVSQLYRVRVSDGYTELLLTYRGMANVGWMRPLTRAWHPTPLILISLALIAIGMIPRRLLQLLDRTLSSFRGH